MDTPCLLLLGIYMPMRLWAKERTWKKSQNPVPLSWSIIGIVRKRKPVSCKSQNFSTSGLLQWSRLVLRLCTLTLTLVQLECSPNVFSVLNSQYVTILVLTATINWTFAKFCALGLSTWVLHHLTPTAILWYMSDYYPLIYWWENKVRPAEVTWWVCGKAGRAGQPS